MSQHVLSVSSEGIVRTLRNQFTRSTTFLSEALQNARRAGASVVTVIWDERSHVMKIRDDGEGISDFEALFTLGRSGWDADVLAEENPFGVGFMSAVLASSQITIRSNDREASFETRTLLNFEPIEVKPITGPRCRGTELILSLHRTVKPPPGPSVPGIASTDPWHHLVCRIAAGFPINVLFNDMAIERPLALDSDRHFIHTEIGDVFLAGYDECKPHRVRGIPRLYHQGLPVSRPDNLDRESPDVLHLDQQRFRLRMPDRDHMIDAHQQGVVIGEALEAIWRKRLIERRAELTPQEFVDSHWTLCNQLNLPELLRDMPLSPSMVSRYSAPVDLTDQEDAELEDWGDMPLPGPDAVFIDRLDDDYSALEGDSPAPLASVYAMARELPVLDSRVPNDHWSRRRVVDILDRELRLTYKMSGRTRSAVFSGRWIKCTVQTCDSYTINFEPTPSCEVPAKMRQALVPVTVDDQAFFDADLKCLIVPSNASDVGDAIRQIDTYRDEFAVWREAEFDHDGDAIDDLVRSLRSRSPHDYLESLLRSLRPDPTLLGRKAFSVRFDSKAKRLIVDRGRKGTTRRSR